ncbi:unnamed protein product [Phaedon cochleariae]|uniref:Regulatory protein zeste n=1 Tax=Phaedon cochleariae TaxID=80249 RepID=A0A9N9SJ02_PHACE|nr:unnamed protein product [Phaedon cochleariae]
MEGDFIFRSSTINPTVDPNYIEKKWEELVGKLNSLGKGPVLSVETWQKRFKDWKNSTRAKYRKIYENRLITGGGVGVKIELTPLEEIGLSVWGKVAVTGRPLVMVSGGLAGSTNDHLDEIENLDETEETAVSTNEGIGDIEEIIILNEATNKFGKKLYKLMNIAVFGMTMENIRKHRVVKLCGSWNGRYGAKNMIASSKFRGQTILGDDLIAIELAESEIVFNKPLYIGMAILDSFKTCM